MDTQPQLIKVTYYYVNSSVLQLIKNDRASPFTDNQTNSMDFGSLGGTLGCSGCGWSMDWVDVISSWTDGLTALHSPGYETSSLVVLRQANHVAKRTHDGRGNVGGFSSHATLLFAFSGKFVTLLRIVVKPENISFLCRRLMISSNVQ